MEKNRFIALAAALAFLTSGWLAPGALAGGTKISNAAIYDSIRSKKKNPLIVGNSTVIRDDNGISFTIRTRGLISGNAYTVWMIIMQKGHKKDDKMIAVNATGGVVGDPGNAFFAGRVGVGKIKDVRGDRSAVRFNGNFHNPSTATIMFAIVDHGEVIPELAHEQLTTRFGGRCANSPANKKKKNTGMKPCKSVQRSLPHKAK